jgi:hypothetical protein
MDEGQTMRVPIDHPSRLRTIAHLDRCVAAGDIDAAVAFAKELAYIDGSTDKTVGWTAIFQIVRSVERVIKK